MSIVTRITPVLLVASALAACAHGNDVRIEADERCPPIQPGRSYAGTQTRKHPQFGWLVAPEFCFRGVAGQRVTFRLHSDSPKDHRRYALLTLRDSDEMAMRGIDLAVEDAPAFSTASGLLPADGEFELSFSVGDAQRDSAEYRLEFLPSPARPVDIEQDLVVDGTLDPKADTLDELGEPSDVFHFVAPKRPELRVYEFVVKSDAFEPEVRVYTKAGFEQPENEYSSGPKYRTIVTGDAYVVVRAADRKGRGAYSFEVRDLHVRKALGIEDD